MIGAAVTTLFNPSKTGRSLLEFSETGVQTPGIGGTKLGQNHNLQLEIWRSNPSSDLGRVPPVDEPFAIRQPDGAPTPGSREQQVVAERWVPFWEAPEMEMRRREQEFDWDFLTEHGPVEGVLLMREQQSLCPPQATYFQNHPRPLHQPSFRSHTEFRLNKSIKLF